MDGDQKGVPPRQPLQDELAEWRRRAEVAEALATERLARAENAERALAALASPPAVPARPAAAAPPAAGSDADPGPAAPETLAERARSLRQWWRRYTDSIN